MIKPNLKWIEFDRDNPPSNLMDSEFAYLILIADYGYQATEKTVPTYCTDMATAYGDYIDNFWDTENDWDEGQTLHVVSYCELCRQVEVSNE